MQTILTRVEMKKSDLIAQRSVPSRELMRRAAAEIFPFVRGKTAIVCGAGNNGGDGYALALLVADVRVFSVGEPRTADAEFYRDECVSAGKEITPFDAKCDLSDFDCVVDCIFGIGFHGVAEGMERAAIEKINASGAFVVSADINSGLDCDNGLGEVCVKSDVTVSFGSFKPGHFLARAKDVIGSCVNRDIGILPSVTDFSLLEETDFSAILRKRENNSHKGTYGTVLILGGCERYSGAVKLANMACAAMRSGCGICRVGVGESIVSSVAPYLLESTLFPIKDGGDIKDALSGVKAVAVGMGWGRGANRAEMLREVLSTPDIGVIIDADGLNALSNDVSMLDSARCRTILTPHPAEFARLCGESVAEILSHPAVSAKRFALEHSCTVLLKGSSSLITDGKETYCVARGCPGMATAGSGDVLSGIILGLCGYNEPSALTASCGAYIAGLAGEIAEKKTNSISMIASDTVGAIPEAVSLLMYAKQ